MLKVFGPSRVLQSLIEMFAKGQDLLGEKVSAPLRWRGTDSPNRFHTMFADLSTSGTVVFLNTPYYGM